MILSPRLMKTVTMGIRTLRRKERLAETVAPIQGAFFFNWTPLNLFLTFKFPYDFRHLRENLGSLHEILGSLQNFFGGNCNIEEMERLA